MMETMNRRQVIAGVVAAASASTSVAAEIRPALFEVIAAYLSARSAYDTVEAIHGDVADQCPEWSDYLSAERALVAHRCADDGERRTKIAFALADGPLLDAVSHDHRDGEPVLNGFLRSLV
jgi:hypothetical protein